MPELDDLASEIGTGWLQKKGQDSILGGWKQRFFRLERASGEAWVLAYFADDAVAAERRGQLRLARGFRVVLPPDDDDDGVSFVLFEPEERGDAPPAPPAAEPGCSPSARVPAPPRAW